MSILISGSVAYDTLMQFSGYFHERLRDQRLTDLSVSFSVPNLRREFGGCGGNIAYSLQQLGVVPRLFATLGHDSDDYLRHLAKCSIDTRYLKVLDDCHTAQCFITSDAGGNQITSFHAGAMERATENALQDALGGDDPVTLAIVAPSGHAGNLAFSEVLAAAKIPFIFDPGQELPLLNRDELLRLSTLADYLTLNAYEAMLFTERAGMMPERLVGQGRLQAVIVTHGQQPVRVTTAYETLEVYPPQARRVADPTGCGDAFRAGILYGISHGWAWRRTVELGCVLGAIKVEHLGPQHHCCSPEVVEARWREAFPQSRDRFVLV